MKRKSLNSSSFDDSSNHSHDIHAIVSPYYSSWQKSYDPEFLKKMSTKVLAKTWGKPSVFRNDRYPMFGNGLVMAEGSIWVHHRHVIAPTFSPLNLKGMASMMVDSTRKMIDKWVSQICGCSIGKLFTIKKTLEAKKLGEEIDKLLLSIIEARMKSDKRQPQQDLLGHLLQENHHDDQVDGQVKKALSMRELVDECKTFFFGGYETTALSITWTLMLLAMHEDWQNQLRDEIKEVVGNDELDVNLLAELKKMKLVMNEALRLYPPSPNVQRQAKEDIQIDHLVVPKEVTFGSML
ncbi:Cytochrome P450 [Sesbania bispinosa]|nr:Cytochrome P450 [Sesbania bispinosa]